jgi:hypothetical protein
MVPWGHPDQLDLYLFRYQLTRPGSRVGDYIHLIHSHPLVLCRVISPAPWFHRGSSVKVPL